MSTRRTLLEELYDKTVERLTQKVSSGDATAADLNVARAMLRDAGISVDSQNPDKATQGLVDALARIDEEEARPN